MPPEPVIWAVIVVIWLATAVGLAWLNWHAINIEAKPYYRRPGFHIFGSLLALIGIVLSILN